MNPATMRRLATMLLIVSLITGLAFAILAIRRQGGVKVAVQKVPVIAARDTTIPAGEMISSSDPRFQVGMLASDQLADDMVRDLRDLDGKVTVAPIEPKQPVRKGQ